MTRHLEVNIHVQRRLCIAGDVCNYALEDLRFVGCGAHSSIQILELDLLPSKVIVEPVELAAPVFFSIFVVEVMSFDPFSHCGGVFLQDAPHLRESEA